MRESESRRGSSAFLVIAGVVGLAMAVGIGGFFLLGWSYMGATRPRAVPPPSPVLVTVDCGVDGKVTYKVDDKQLHSETELTAELKRITPLEEFREGAGIEVQLLIISVQNDDGDTFTREHYRKMVAACRAAGALVKASPPPGSGSIKLTVDTDKSGRIFYRVGSSTVVTSLEALRSTLEKLVKDRGELKVRAEVGEGVFKDEFEGAKQVCVEAGASRVDDTWVMPFQLDPTMSAVTRARGRRAEIKVRAVGCRDGTLQIRVDGRLVEGNVKLTEAVRERIKVIEEEKGGWTLVSPSKSYSPELIVSDKQCDAVTKAFWASGARCWEGFLGFRDGGGRRRNSQVKSVTVNILTVGPSGNIYTLGASKIDGEKALVSALKAELVAWRKDKTDSEIYSLEVNLRVEVKPGVTATEKQIALAHKTITSAGVERLRKKAEPLAGAKEKKP